MDISTQKRNIYYKVRGIVTNKHIFFNQSLLKIYLFFNTWSISDQFLFDLNEIISMYLYKNYDIKYLSYNDILHEQKELYDITYDKYHSMNYLLDEEQNNQDMYSNKEIEMCIEDFYT